MTYVKKRDLFEIEKLAREYTRFQHTLARLTKINQRIRFLLEEIRDLNCQDVDEYRKKSIQKRIGENERSSQGMDKE